MNHIHENVDESGSRIRRNGGILQRIIDKVKAAVSRSRDSSDSQNHRNLASRVQEMAQLRISDMRNQEAVELQSSEQSQQAEASEEK